MAVPMVSSAEGVTFEGFKRLASSFRMAGVALRDVQICLVKGRKSFCVAGAILLRRFQKIRYSFRGRRSTLDVSIVIFRGRRSALDVSCSVFFPTSLCGVLVFGCALPPRLPPRPSRPARPTHDHTHTQFVHTLHGRRGSYGTGLALVACLGPSGRRGRRGCWRGRRGTW